jgi:hypothetical protein
LGLIGGLTGATLSGLRPQNMLRDPGLPKRNPGLKLANAFGVIVKLTTRNSKCVFTACWIPRLGLLSETPEPLKLIIALSTEAV